VPSICQDTCQSDCDVLHADCDLCGTGYLIKAMSSCSQCGSEQVTETVSDFNGEKCGYVLGIPLSCDYEVTTTQCKTCMGNSSYCKTCTKRSANATFYNTCCKKSGTECVDKYTPQQKTSLECPVALKPTVRPQYILDKGLRRKADYTLAPAHWQNKAIKDVIDDDLKIQVGGVEECLNVCDPYKFRHFQYAGKTRTCICIKQQRDELTLTGDPNRNEFKIYDFTVGLIHNAHDMCYCEGFSLLNGIPKSCPKGRYSSKLTPCSATCELCPVGKFSTPGSSECGGCVPGEIQTSPTECSKCDAGKFSEIGDIECTDCPPSTYSEEKGASACTQCAAGTFADPNLTGQTSSNVCQNCPAGYEQSEPQQTSCDICVGGKFSAAGASSCSGCQAGKYHTLTGQTSSASCIDCPNGYYSDTIGQSSCKECDAGRYQDQHGQTSCKACSVGRASYGKGKSLCSTCSAGKYANAGWNACGDCYYGYYSSSGWENCAYCPQGYWQDQLGQSACKACPVVSTTGFEVGRLYNGVSHWGDVSGYGYGFTFPNTDRTKVDSCAYIQNCDYNLQNDNPPEGFNYDNVHCSYEGQSGKIDGYIPSKYVLRCCWTKKEDCNDVLSSRLFNYDLKNSGRNVPGWRQCETYLKGYRL